MSHDPKKLQVTPEMKYYHVCPDPMKCEICEADVYESPIQTTTQPIAAYYAKIGEASEMTVGELRAAAKKLEEACRPACAHCKCKLPDCDICRDVCRPLLDKQRAENGELPQVTRTRGEAISFNEMVSEIHRRQYHLGEPCDDPECYCYDDSGSRRSIADLYQQDADHRDFSRRQKLARVRDIYFEESEE